MRIFIGYKAWKEEEYLLNRMTFDDLVKAYITYPAIQIYAAILIVALIAGIATISSIWLFLGAFAAGAVLFPIAWYITHRFILHGSWMYKTPWLSGLWKRVHYDHHLYPNDLSVLFGGLHTTLPTIVLVAGPLGWLIGGFSGACGAVAGTVVMTMYTEFLHAGEHLAFQPKSKFWQDMKRRHLAHHFHNEKGNYGIAEFFWDRRFGTFYDETTDAPRSATARNLGYTSEMAEKFPWVRELTESEPEGSKAMRNRGAAS